jgi:hypothetical protein
VKILYLSCHEILEHDELKMFTELGHECYSLGAYTNPYGDEGRKRPGLPGMPYDPHFTELATRYGKENLHPEMLEGVDVVLIMHVPEYVTANWEHLRHVIARGGRVVWRSIGQSVPHIEQTMATFRNLGMEIVRYSPREARIPHYAGHDAVIRFGKDPEEYGGNAPWTGASSRVVNFTQSLAQRGSHCGWDLLSHLQPYLPLDLYGPGNEGVSWSKGLVSYQEQKQVLREAGAYLYTGTHPASYTLGFIEAWMTGVPMVAVGPTYGHPHRSGYPQETYEVHDLLVMDETGFWSDDAEHLVEFVQVLLRERELAKEISESGRARAIQLFGTGTIRKQWGEFLGT